MLGKRQIIRRILRKSKRPLSPKYLASCHGKVRHATYEEAKAAAALKPEKVKPYKCKFCPYYHIGRRATNKSKSAIRSKSR